MKYKVIGNIVKELSNNIDIIMDDSVNINDICNKLNGGSGFNGFTPPFFAKRVN